jgi:uncharacterized repeat protein (TIGR01451 family)
MNAGVIPLLASLAIGAPPEAAPPAPPTPPSIIRTSWSQGVLPTPGMGPPGAVAAVGANPGPGPAIGIAMPPPAPLVAAKFLLPEGARVTAFPGSNLARVYGAPIVMGLRPGYVFRFELDNIGVPGRTLYPEVELRGVLVPRPGMRYMDYPIPIFFSQLDIDRALNGVLITKVIYLEDPERALPVAMTPDLPIESPDATERDALRAARELGRPIAVVRLGDRKPSIPELQTVAVSGTILLPGEKYLRAPLLPPVFRCDSIPMYDPILGARIPTKECFPNGGDRKDPLGVAPDGQMAGLNVTDVGVMYTLNGKRGITTSNVARICAPRFLIRRVEEIPAGFENREILAANVAPITFVTIKERFMPMAEIAREKANEFASRMRPSIYVGKIGTGFFLGTSRPVVIGQVEGVKVEAALVEPEQITFSPSCMPLTVAKIVDPPGPKQVGDIVTITIRYANTGFRPISDLVVSDNLSPRLEYILGSAETDRAANFSVAENPAGSAIVSWELPGDLFPGQGGTVKFKARIR